MNTIKSSDALIEEYCTFAQSKGKVWANMTKDEICEIVTEYHEAQKAQAKQTQVQAQPAQAQQTQAQPCEVVKKSWFNLLGGNAKQVLDHIAQLTNGFSVLEPTIAQILINRVNYRPYTTFGYLPAPFNKDITEVDVVKQIIGKDGYYLKLTTANTGVDFIWHDRVENHFLFWGEKACVVKAMKIIQSRIEKHYPSTF